MPPNDVDDVMWHCFTTTYSASKVITTSDHIVPKLLAILSPLSRQASTQPNHHQNSFLLNHPSSLQSRYVIGSNLTRARLELNRVEKSQTRA